MTEQRVGERWLSMRAHGCAITLHGDQRRSTSCPPSGGPHEVRL